MGGGGGDNEVKETVEQRELAKIAAEKWGKYQQIYVPMENEFMANVDDMGSEWQSDRAAGSANKSVQEEFGGLSDAVQKRSFEAGVNPNSGRFAAQTSEIAEAKADSGAQTEVGARVKQQDAHIEGLSNVVKLGQGQSVSAQQGLSDVASDSASQAASAAKNAYQRQTDTNNMLGTAGGMATSYGLNQSTKKEDS